MGEIGWKQTERMKFGTQMTASDKNYTKLVNAGLTRLSKVLTARLATHGLRKTKKLLWIREHEFHADFLIIQRSGGSYGAAISAKVNMKIHFGIRIYNDSLEGLGLLGPYNDPTTLRKGRYHLSFNAETDHMFERCMDDLERFVLEVGLPWFNKYLTAEELLSRDDSPIHERVKPCLRAHIEGEPRFAFLTRSNKLLGIRDT